MSSRSIKPWGIALSLALSLSLTACDDAFLDRQPLDAISDQSFWKTDEQLQLAANGLYAYLKGKNTVDMENLGDNTYNSSANDYQRIGSGVYANDLGTLNSEWAGDYDGIRRANHFLANYQKADAAQAKKDRYAAEVRFIRAYLYFYLTQFFGDVQYVTRPLEINDPEVYGTRLPKAQIVDSLLAELTEIAPQLPKSYNLSEYGRITQGAALALKARIALYNQRWDVAEQAAREVMDLGVYELYSTGNPATDYAELFTWKGRASRNSSNKETILARVYLQDEDDHNMSREVWVPDQQVRWNPTRSLVDAYLMSDGMPKELSPLYKETTYGDYFANRDPRMTQTVLTPGSAWGGRADGRGVADGKFMVPKFVSDKKGAATITGWYFNKYVEPTTVGQVSRDENDIVLIRYAEVLLTYAEAMLEQGKLTQAVLDETVNKIRERVGMHPMRLDELAAWGLDVREELRRERRIELALEGQRYFDIIRWGKGDLLAQPVLGMKASLAPAAQVKSVNKDANGYVVVSQNRQFTPGKHELWPIPLTQLERNPKLGQNPNW